MNEWLGSEEVFSTAELMDSSYIFETVFIPSAIPGNCAVRKHDHTQMISMLQSNYGEAS